MASSSPTPVLDPSASLDHFAERRDLLRGFLHEYQLLTKEHPELSEQLTFDGFVHFSFAYFRISEQTGGVARIHDVLADVKQKIIER